MTWDCSIHPASTAGSAEPALGSPYIDSTTELTRAQRLGSGDAAAYKTADSSSTATHEPVPSADIELVRSFYPQEWGHHQRILWRRMLLEE